MNYTQQDLEPLTDRIGHQLSSAGVQCRLLVDHTLDDRDKCILVDKHLMASNIGIHKDKAQQSAGKSVLFVREVLFNHHLGRHPL